MKKTLIGLLAAFVGPGLHAQTYAPQTTSALLLPVIQAESSVTLTNAIFDCRKQKTLALQLSFALVDAGTNGAVTFTFARSVDGSNFESLAAKRTSIEATANGTTTVGRVYYVDSYGAGYLKLISVANADQADLTNLVVKSAVKINAP